MAFSAGSQPAKQVHPLTMAFLSERGIPTTGLHCQSWDAFKSDEFDAVITLCDSAATENCPLWMGTAIKLHWPLPDPTQITGSEADIRAAFYDVMDIIEQRVDQLLALKPLSQTERQAALKQLTEE